MAKQFFEPTKLSNESLSLVVTMNNILTTYKDQGYDLSLRQLYYQLVSRNIVPNTEASYKRIGNILSDARLCGYVDWDMIVDRGRETACAKQFRYDLWDNQPWHVEVMVEKQALEGVLEPVCKKLDVPFTANKGYSSSSAMHDAGKRLREKLEQGKHIYIVYLGDHDPSGIDMTRDVEDRLKLFSGYQFYQPTVEVGTLEWKEAFRTRRFHRYTNKDYVDAGQEFVVERVALTMDQIEEYNPPPNPAKLTDSRSDKYVQQYGDESWELDALEPRVLASLVEECVQEHLDLELYNEALDAQEGAREKLAEIAQENQ